MRQKPPRHEVLLRRLAQGDSSAVAPLKAMRFPHQSKRLREAVLSAPSVYARVLAAEVLGAVGTSEDVEFIAEVAAEARNPILARGLAILLATLADRWPPAVLDKVEALARRTDPQIKQAVASGLFVYIVGGKGGQEVAARILPLMPPECAARIRRAIALTL